ncbi:MAG: hypothetical protein JNJ45_06595 [Chthonomonas sp.]|nr:hypothetical protein [Chthonomonas sp.]
MKTRGFVLLFAVPALASAQTYRLNFQPKVGSVVRHQVSVNVSGKSSDPADDMSLSAFVVLEVTQTITGVTRERVYADLTVRAISTSDMHPNKVPPDFLEWKKGTKLAINYPSNNPAAFLNMMSPESKDGDITAGTFMAAPMFTTGRVTVGDYWDVTKESLSNLNVQVRRAQPSELTTIGQAVTQFIGVKDGIGLFESHATLPIDFDIDILKMQMEVGMNTEMRLDMATTSLHSIDTESKVRIMMGGGNAPAGEPKPQAFETTIWLKMKVRALP